MVIRKLAVLVFLMMAIGLSAPVLFAQNDGTELGKLTARAASVRTELGTSADDAKKQQALLRDLSSTLDRIGQLRFEQEDYENATKAFAEATEALKKYHELRFAEARIELQNADQELAGLIADHSRPNRDMLIPTYRDSIVRNALTNALSEAEYTGDLDAQKSYLSRLNELANDSGDPSRHAEFFEKSGQLEFESGNGDAAFALWDKALQLRQTAAKDEYRTLDYIAKARSYLGEFDKALELYKRIADIARSLSAQPVSFRSDDSVTLREAVWLEHGLYQMTLVQSLLDTAQIYQSRGSYGIAGNSVLGASQVLDQMRAAIDQAEPGSRATLTLLATTMQANLSRSRGRLAEARGDEAAAIADYTNAIDTYSRLGNAGSTGVVASLRVRLAFILAGQKKFDGARAQIREAMAIRARLHQESGTTVALMQASRIELADNKIDAALRLAGEAKSSAAIVGLDDIMAEADEVEADAFFAKAGSSAHLLDSAIRGYESSVKTYKQLDLQPLLIGADNSLGVAYEKAGRAKDAEAAYKEAVTTAEAMRRTFSDEGDSAAFANRDDVASVYRRLVDLLAKQGRAEEALQYTSRAQRRDLVAAVPSDAIKNAAVKQVTVAAERADAARTALNNSRGNAAPADAANQKALETTLGSARQEYALAVKHLETEQPDLRFTVRPTDLLKLQSSIAPTEAIVSYLVTADRLYIFVVRRDKVAVRSVEISQRELRVLVAQIRQGIKDFGEDFYAISGDPDESFAKEKASVDLRIGDASDHYKKLLAPVAAGLRDLNAKLIAPIDDLVGDAPTLKIIPNAELFLLPFSALLSKDGKYLIERHELLFLTAGDLINSPLKAHPSTELVAFGDPTEANLDGALEEVKAIQKVFPHSQLYTEDKATKAQLFQIHSARILHFATHGYIRSPLETSAIHLAHLPNLSSPDLTYGEIYALPLESSDMIVLSACETALGSISGTEVGVFVEAFRTKTNTVAASLWSVDDFATRELMVEFYTQLAAGRSRASAMRAAQRKLLADGRTKNPLFWAAFVLYGDGGPLNGVVSTRSTPRK